MNKHFHNPDGSVTTDKEAWATAWDSWDTAWDVEIFTPLELKGFHVLNGGPEDVEVLWGNKSLVFPLSLAKKIIQYFPDKKINKNN